MSIKFNYKGKEIECSTANEAIELLKFLSAEERKELTRCTGVSKSIQRLKQKHLSAAGFNQKLASER